MRKIQFRGKRKDNAQWVEGCYQKLVIHGVMRHFILPANSLVFDNIKLIDSLIEVIPETVGQFTGLTDNNGKEIYEGDIVKWIDSDKRERIDTVMWKNGGMILCNQQYTVGVYLFNELIVIGNIHDNSELLTNKE